MSTENTMTSVMRSMAWERAKGELQSMMYTYLAEGVSDGARYEAFKEASARFIDDVEDRGLAE